MEFEFTVQEILRLYTILSGVKERDRKYLMKAQKENAPPKVERYYKNRLEEDEKIIKKLNRLYVAEMTK